MHKFKVEKQIAAGVEDVWNVLDDFANTHVFHPIVASSGATNDKTQGLGARRFCEMYDGGRVEEEVTRYDPAGRSFDVLVIDHGPFPMKHMEVTISVEAVHGGTQVTFDGRMLPKFGPMGWLMAKMVMIGQFEKMMGQVIDGIEAHVQTGRVVGEGGELGELVGLNTAAA